MKKSFLSLILLSAFVFQVSAQTVKITKKERQTVEGVTAKQLSDYLYFVASDEMEGRDTPSRGLDTTAKFIALNLSRWGLKPAGDDGTYFQKIALRREAVDPDTAKLVIGGKSYKFGEDFYRISGSGMASGELVYGGDGWMVKAKGIDALAGVDVKGKIVVISAQGFNQRTMTPPPEGVTQDELKGERGVDWADPRTNANAKGAAGVIFIAPPQLQGMWSQLSGFLGGRGAVSPEKLREDRGSAPSVPFLLVSKAVGDAIFAGESIDMASAKSVAMSKTADLAAESMKETVWTQNVVALWEGSDPVLKKEMVAIGAHYDHIGMNPNAPGDKISNGADDDGSGTVAVLSIAEALARAPLRPKRSILFVWHCGEEKGLWGSEYFNKFPTVDIKNVVAQLNIDMIGRSLDPNNIIKCDKPRTPCNEELSKADEIYIIGSEMMSSKLGEVVKGTNNSYLKLGYNTKYDDLKDTNQFFFRSDHYNYAVNGIPITFWFDGVHEDYHQPGDEPQKIDYNKMEKVTRTIMLTMLELADLKERPKVDRQLPAELTQR